MFIVPINSRLAKTLSQVTLRRNGNLSTLVRTRTISGISILNIVLLASIAFVENQLLE